MDTTYLPINSQPYTNCFVTKVRFIHPNYNPFPLVNNMLFFLKYEYDSHTLRCKNIASK